MTTKPMIENSDRGITLNKQLAWTLAVALVGGGIWVGTTVTGLQSESRAQAEALAELRELIAADRLGITQELAQDDLRLRALETGASRTDARFDALAASLNEVKDAQRETNELLRRLTTNQP